MFLPANFSPALLCSVLFASAAPLHLGNPFAVPFNCLKVWHKIAYTVWETGRYINGQPIPTPDEYHPGWVEFSVKYLSLQAIDDICRTQQQIVSRIIITKEKIHLRLDQEIDQSETFPFEDAYSTLDIYLVEDPSEYLSPETATTPDWNHCWDEALDIFDEFDDWCFPSHETFQERIERRRHQQLQQPVIYEVASSGGSVSSSTTDTSDLFSINTHLITSTTPFTDDSSLSEFYSDYDINN